MNLFSQQELAGHFTAMVGRSPYRANGNNRYINTVTNHMKAQIMEIAYTGILQKNNKLLL
jgi:hypothetical protein